MIAFLLYLILSLINFFLLERESNRKQCADVNNSNIWEYPDVISKNMSELERRNNEILSSIKINAPLDYAAQGRAVTVDDYKT